MALCNKLAARSPRLLRKPHFIVRPPIQQTFVTAQPSLIHPPQSTSSCVPKYQTRRTFATSPKRSITGEEAPSAKAYISSGVISGHKDLVDVKKVLVIGSGGLSIGQAGEFDYSGMTRDTLRST
jgi:carbamoyl-phosphate synthase large subunit